MPFWIRDATLVIGSNKYTLDGLHFSFEIPFEDSDEPPVATVRVMNLSENTRAGIRKNDPVILNAGYQGDVGCILVGTVVGLKHKQANVDWTTTLTVQPCASEILGKMINKTYKENTAAMTIVQDLLNIFGLPARPGLPWQSEEGADRNRCHGVQEPVHCSGYRAGLHHKGGGWYQ